VDDEEKSRLYLAEIVHELYPTFLFQFAASPFEALFILEKQKMDLIFLDVEMPGMTGLDLLEELRKKVNNTPVVFVSGYKRAEFIQKALRLNAIDYIDKPVDPEELRNAIEKSFSHKTEIGKVATTQNTNNVKLCLSTINGDMLFEPDEIMYFESNKRESIAYFQNGFPKVSVRENLKSLIETILPNEHFLRVSRQYIINKRFVKFISQSNNSITLADGHKKIILNRIFPDIFKNQKLSK
jgi:two-component system LytT family response regulator